MARVDAKRRRLIGLLDAHGWRCALCRGPVADIADANLDHIVPRSAGGRATLDNLQPTHIMCNTLRGSGDTVFSCVLCRGIFRWMPNFESHWILRCPGRTTAIRLAAGRPLTKRALARAMRTLAVDVPQALGPEYVSQPQVWRGP